MSFTVLYSFGWNPLYGILRSNFYYAFDARWRRKKPSVVNVSSHKRGKTKLFFKKTYTFRQRFCSDGFKIRLEHKVFPPHATQQHPRSCSTNPFIPSVYRSDLIFVCSFYVSFSARNKTYFFSAIHPNLFSPWLCVRSNNNNDCCMRQHVKNWPWLPAVT